MHTVQLLIIVSRNKCMIKIKYFQYQPDKILKQINMYEILLTQTICNSIPI